MGLRRAMLVLAEQWDDIHGRLSPEQIAEISALVDEFTREGDRAVAEEIAEEAVDLLRRWLPHDHSLHAALLERTERLAPDPARRAVDLTDWLEVAEALRVVMHGDTIAGADDVEHVVIGALLSVPALGAEDLVARGQSLTDPGLIRLQIGDGTPLWPAFQFADEGPLLPIVRSVNEILDAVSDPLGAADWWLGGNGRLGDAPVRLIGRLPEEQLIAAARDELGEA